MGKKIDLKQEIPTIIQSKYFFYIVHVSLTNSMAYGTRRFNAAFTRALQ